MGDKMSRIKTMLLSTMCVALTAGVCSAQTQQTEPATNMISGTVAAIGYPVGGGGTKVSMVGTPAAPQANGEGKVDAKVGGTAIELKVMGMPQPTTLGAEFLTYVLWTVTPDGTTTNLGEIPINQSGQGGLQVKAQSQTFALIVTAEPYYAVRMPSELVILVNETRKNTKGKIYPNNSYKLMKRSDYSREGNPLALTPDLKKVPIDMYEARNAVEIAKSRGAEQYAPEIFLKAQSSLKTAENVLAQGSDKNRVISAARQTTQFAEDARSLSAQLRETARIEKEKEEAAAQAKAQADAQAAVEAHRQAELTAAREAQMKAESQAKAAEAKMAADQAAAKAAAEQAALQAKEEAAKEEAARAQAATAALRAQLLQQLNEVLQTTDTPRGLMVNMADVLFESGKYALSTDAQLKLAKLSGIIQAHPGLNLAIEGHTDNTGTPELNMKLSQQRSDAVRQFLTTQGLLPDSISSSGFGQDDPIADNNTATGRKQNRRVEIIVSGEVIGAEIGKGKS
jgi:outer membrane protein OmpA-like peptidoglycan-associated protein